MEFISQKSPIEDLEKLASKHRHSIIITGPKGSGKSFLAKKYAEMLDIFDYMEIAPKVDDIRTSITNCLSINNPVVLCVENLDCGVLGAAYSLLKFLEEPADHVYIVVTARNIQKVPDTILSRSTLVTTAPPVKQDIELYASSKNFPKFHELESTTIWKCVNTFSEADLVMGLSPDQLRYFENLKDKTKFNDTISNMSWQLSHYDNNSECPVELVIRYLMEIVNTPHIKACGISCLSDIQLNRIATHAVLAKFLFEMKYTTS